MPKVRNVSELIDPILADPKRRANVERHRRETIAEIIAYTLAEVRKARAVTQTDLARVLQVQQSSVSRLEHEDDPHLSTLREYVEALGGRLEVAAVFDEERIQLDV